jgi:fatty-acyl-CoA synthase
MVIGASWAAKDRGIRGGENIYLREVEETMCLRGAAARRPGGRGRHPRLLPRQIAHYYVPRHVRLADSFPTTVTGKVQKQVLRQQMELAGSAALSRRLRNL